MSKTKTLPMCVVCESPVRRQNCDTCDPTCTQAKKNGITRQEQFKLEMDARPWGDNLMFQFDKDGHRRSGRVFNLKYEEN